MLNIILDPLQRTNEKSFVTPVFFNLLSRFWCLNVRELCQKSIGEGFKLIAFFLAFLKALFLQSVSENLTKNRLLFYIFTSLSISHHHFTPLSFRFAYEGENQWRSGNGGVKLLKVTYTSIKDG